jgi:FkbM family methyltransferase
MNSDFKFYRKSLKRLAYELVGNDRYSKPSIDGLDDKLANYLDFRNGFFIEAGAHDGYNHSNTYYLEKMLGWRGVLVEAVPRMFSRCKNIRRRSRVFNCALVDKDYPGEEVEMHYAGLMSLVKGARKNPQAEGHHIAQGLNWQKLDGTYRFKVWARTLESILDTLPQPVSIDFFSLDVEGFEAAVLRGLNLDKYQPRYILVEADYFDEVNDLLKDNYELVEVMSSHDYFYSRK